MDNTPDMLALIERARRKDGRGAAITYELADALEEALKGAAKMREVINAAPEAYEYMSKSDFNHLPVPMRGFVDAWKQWVKRARSLANGGNA